MTGALTAAIAAAFSGSAVVTDPQFEYTTLLLPGNGTDLKNNNEFLDSSSNAFTVTRNPLTGPNAPTQGTFSPFSQTGWGNYFNGSSYLSLSNGAVLAAGTLNFTMECWVYPTTDQQASTYAGLLHIGASASGSCVLNLAYSSAGAMTVRFSTFTADYATTYTISPNRWYHLAVVREGTGANQTKIYIDGELRHSFTLSDNLSNSSGLYIGSTIYNITGRRLYGYISNMRYTVGAALYTTTFTPSTSPLTTTSQGATASQVELLTCQNNRFVDNSSNAWTFTTSGSPSVQAFSPFNPTASWSATTNGGSGYFDGSGDYLTTQNTGQFAPAGNFTIGLWFYPTSLAAAFSAPLGNFTGNNSTDWLIEITSAGVLNFYTNGSTVRIASSSGAVKANQWQYIALCRSSSTITGYLNGDSVGTYSQSGTFGSATKSIGIGARPDSQEPVTGYISSVILIDGSVNTSVPAAPSTNVSGTSLLLNFTNAGIYDATSKNDLETVDGAKISTAQSKWGGSSMAFDGTGDYLVGPANNFYNFGTGDFTIECWLRLNATSSAMIIASTNYNSSTGGGGWAFIYRGDISSLSLSVNSNVTYTKSWSPSTSNWYHVAASRSGSSLRLFVDGTQIGTTSTSTDNVSGSSTIVVAGNLGGGTNLVLNGYLQDLRITNYARYTANFTPPTAAFPTL